MKIKELIEHLRNFDGELEVYTYESVLSSYFKLELDVIQGKAELYEIDGEFHQASDAVEMCECNEEEFDDSKVKKGFIL